MQRAPDNLRYFNEEVRRLKESDRQSDRSFDGGDGGGYDESMEARVAKLEEFVSEARTELRAIDVRLTKIEARVDQSATKSDVTDAINGQIKWIVGTAVVLGGLALTVMTFVLNNAIPKTPATPPTQLVIPLQLQAPQAPTETQGTSTPTTSAKHP